MKSLLVPMGFGLSLEEPTSSDARSSPALPATSASSYCFFCSQLHQKLPSQHLYAFPHVPSASFTTYSGSSHTIILSNMVPDLTCHNSMPTHFRFGKNIDFRIIFKLWVVNHGCTPLALEDYASTKPHVTRNL